MENRAVASAKDRARKAEVSARLVPRPLRHDAKPARGRDPLELADNWIPCSPHFQSLFVTGYLPSSLLPDSLACEKVCRRIQQTNGRRRLTTEWAIDAVHSLNELAAQKGSSLTPCMHVESVDKSILPSGAISVVKLFDVGRQLSAKDRDRGGALSAAQGDVRLFCLVVSLPSGVHDCPHIFDVVGSTG